MEYPRRFNSWVLVSEDTIVKEIDKSCFADNSSGIPVNVRPFFDIEEIVPNERITIRLMYSAKEYSAELVMKETDSKRTTLRWKNDFKIQLRREFPDLDHMERNKIAFPSFTNHPKIRFEKDLSQKNTYHVNLIDPEKIHEDNVGEDEHIITEALIKEGKLKIGVSRQYERNASNRLKAIEIHGLTCKVCGFNFEEHYGDIGKGYIEIHHIKPLSQQSTEHAVDPRTDLVPLCSNCHRVIHRGKDNCLSLEELKQSIVDSE